MNNLTSRPHWSFRGIGGFALIWHVLGSANYLMQTSAEIVASLPDTHRAIIETRPAWATAGFAIAVFGGAIAALLLLMKRTMAIYLFVASLLGAIIAGVHTTGVAGSTSFSGGEIFVMILSPVFVGIFFTWYARYAGKRGWTR